MQISLVCVQVKITEHLKTAVLQGNHQAHVAVEPVAVAMGVKGTVDTEDEVWKKAKYPTNNLFLLVKLSKWYFGYFGLNKILLKLISQSLKWGKWRKDTLLLD